MIIKKNLINKTKKKLLVLMQYLTKQKSKKIKKEK